MRFYVVFSEDSTYWGWWDVFTSNRWRHSSVFWDTSTIPDVNLLQHVEYIRGRLHVDTFLVRPEDWLKILIEKDLITAVVEYDVANFESFRYNLRGLITCVSVVKAIIGVKAPVVFTPKQLAHELLSQGGKLIWVGEADQVVQRKGVLNSFKLFRPNKHRSFGKRNLKRSVLRLRAVGHGLRLKAAGVIYKLVGNGRSVRG